MLSLVIAQKGGEVADAVMFLVERHVGNVGYGGERIVVSAEKIAGLARLNLSGPAHKQRNADTSLVDLALEPAEPSDTVEELVIDLVLEEGGAVV